MSVAFRRDSDEEHLEPKFERPIAPGPNLVTAHGLALIDAEVARIDAALEQASEEDRVALLRDRRYWHTRQTTAEVVGPPAPGEIGIGSQVTFVLGGTERTVQIVGGDEADPAAGRIGFQAPLARALIGAEVGETVAFGGKADAIAIMRVSG
ncbi:GreA/GreB family elongation factor [Sphingomonas sp. PAMC 26621]|uniref:GreA/GreB family elongation factor n=1 Tax=Sphingomonas sp. PAMC 26621 TaxID=1112213 RepID=UPI000289B28E|nr:GreA/GreB family elongation factor [Sphingomonas sp. PAMC 26621]